MGPGVVRAYVGLGANLGDPRAQVQAGFGALEAMPGTRLAGRSSLYLTAPQLLADQPDFVNAVAALDTALGPCELLEALLRAERAQGRVRGIPNGPRTLDLDLLLYGALVVQEPGLVVPHPRLAERAFVLHPLAELAPGLVVPGLGPLAGLLPATAGQRLRQLPP